MPERAVRIPRRRFLARPPGRRRAGRPGGDPRPRAGQGRRRAAQRTDRHGRHRHRRPRLLRTWAASCSEPDVRFVAGCDVRADRRAARQEDRSTPSTANRLHGSIATSASCWPAATSTPCSSPPAPTGTRCCRSMRPRPARTCIARSPARRPSWRAWRWPRRSAAPARVFQGGMQRRNLPHFEFAVELARQGKLGKLQAVHAHPGGLGTAHQRLGTGAARAAQGARSTGTCSSARRPGGRSTRACSTRASRRAAGWSAAGAWNGAPTASTCASGPTTPTTRPRSSTSRSTTARPRPATPTA